MSYLAVGSCVDDHFEVTEHVGSGSMGAVYKAVELGLQRIVAIKILHSHLVGDEEQRARFLREGRILSRLAHKNVLLFFKFGIIQGGTPYIAMEYLEGVSLHEVIGATGGLEFDRALNISIQICEGMAHAHSLGIIHRDLKPGNIVLIEEGGAETVKVVDFGLAAMAGKAHSDGLTQTGELIGSIYYMSPEHCQGKRPDHRSDIYSIGCVIYEMLAGAPPLVADNPIGMLHKHAHELPVAVSNLREVPKQVDIVLNKAMAKDPEERYQSFALLKNDLSKLLIGELNLAESDLPPELQERKLRSLRPLQICWLSGAASLILLVCVLMAGALRQKSVDAQDNKSWLSSGRSLSGIASQYKRARARGQPTDELINLYLKRAEELPLAADESEYFLICEAAHHRLLEERKFDDSLKLWDKLSQWNIKFRGSEELKVMTSVRKAGVLRLENRIDDAHDEVSRGLSSLRMSDRFSNLSDPLWSEFATIYLCKGDIKNAIRVFLEFSKHADLLSESYKSALRDFLSTLMNKGYTEEALEVSLPFLAVAAKELDAVERFEEITSMSSHCAVWAPQNAKKFVAALEEIIKSPNVSSDKKQFLLCQLAFLQELKGNFAQGESLYRRACRGSRPCSGLLRCLSAQGKSDEVKKLLEQIDMASLGPVEYLQIQRVKAQIVAQEQGALAGIALVTAAIEDEPSTAKAPPGQKQVVESEKINLRRDLAVLYCKVGRAEPALASLQQAYAEQVALYGDKNPGSVAIHVELEQLKKTAAQVKR